MACIGCGLGLNADNTGRVDVDPNGGIECQGGAGGLVNTVGSGLRIKKDGAAGNSITVGAGGLYVPRKSRFEVQQNSYIGGAIGNPGVGSGGSAVSSPIVSVAIDNTASASPKTFVYEASLYISAGADPTSSTARWLELAIQDNGGGWNTPVAIIVATNQFLMPWHTGKFVVTVPAGTSRQLDARAIFYTGDYAGYRVTLTAWGDYSD